MKVRMILLSLIACLTIKTFAQSADLRDRYENLACSLVRITSNDNFSGTGFFVSDSGTVVTAAHVVLRTTFSLDGKIVQVNLEPLPKLKLTTTYNSVRDITPTTTDEDKAMAAADLAVVRTNLTPRCHLEIGDSRSARIGAHLIAMGYPGYDNPSSAITAGVLYEGFLSSRHPHIPIPVGSIGLQTFTATHEVLKVQMPITLGASGSPVIGDDDKVIGVISEEPVFWTKQLDDFLEAYNSNPQLQAGMIITFGNGQSIDPTRLLAQLSAVVHDFESPGSGLAVPTYYLKLPKDAARPGSTSVH